MIGQEDPQARRVRPPQTRCLCHDIFLFLGPGALKNEVHRSLGVDALVQLGLQRRFRFRQDSALRSLALRQLRQGRELALEIRCRNPVPETVFEGQDIDLFLFDAQNGGVGQADQDFVGPQIDGHVLLQIEACLRRESGVQFYALGAARPGVLKFLFHLDLPRTNGELRRRGRFLQINSIIHRHPRLELGHFSQSVPNIATDPFQFGCGLFRGPARPRLEA